jgi:hypothetical protein
MKYILGSILCLLNLMVFAAIQTQVEPSEINKNQIFKLILTDEETKNSAPPNLAPLQRDFTIVGTEHNMNYSIINGQMHAVNQWIVSLRAKHTGIINIPAINIGNDASAPTTIHVSEESTRTSLSESTQPQDVVLTATVSMNKAYINQEIIYTVKLFNSKRLLDATYQGPTAEDALIIPLGEANRYQTIDKGVNYVVEEQKYAVFPQKSGQLTIKSPTFSALVYDYEPQRVAVEDKPLQLTILAAHKLKQASSWLPAQNISLTEHYEQTAQKQNLGSTLTRTIIIEGIGIPAQLLPVFHFSKTNAYKVYPEPGKEKNQVIQGELKSRKEIKVTYLFNQPGVIYLPELKLFWFNTQTGKEEAAILPPRSIEVLASTSNAKTRKPLQKDNELLLDKKSHHHVLKSSLNTNWTAVLAILFAFAWTLTLILWWRQKYAGVRGYKGAYKTSLASLNKACKVGAPARARDALLLWARLNWPNTTVLNLTDVLRLTRDNHLKKQLHALSQVLYQNDAKKLWRGDELWRAVVLVKQQGKKVKKNTNALPPINPLM